MKLYYHSKIAEGKRKLVCKIGHFKKSGVKLHCSTKERETTFGSSYRKVRKIEGSRNRDSTVVILNLAYSMTSIDSLVKSETYKRNSKLFLIQQENLKRLFVEPFKTARFRATTKTNIYVLVCLDSVIVLLMEVIQLYPSHGFP